MGGNSSRELARGIRGPPRSQGQVPCFALPLLPRRLAGFGVAAGLALALAASFPSHASAASATGCSVQKRAARIVSVKRFKRQIRPARAAFFRKHGSARARHAFRAGQQRRLTALKRAVKQCGSAGGTAVPEAAPDPVPPPCSPSLYSAPFTEMNEGTTNTALPLRPAGPIRAVMLFVDFPDLHSSESASTLYDRLVRRSRAWYDEVSYGRVQTRRRPREPVVPDAEQPRELRAPERDQLARAPRLHGRRDRSGRRQRRLLRLPGRLRRCRQGHRGRPLARLPGLPGLRHPGRRSRDPVRRNLLPGHALGREVRRERLHPRDRAHPRPAGPLRRLRQPQRQLLAPLPLRRRLGHDEPGTTPAGTSSPGRSGSSAGSTRRSSPAWTDPAR